MIYSSKLVKLLNERYSFHQVGSDEIVDNGYISKNDLLELMEEAWNLAIHGAADNADADFNVLGEGKETLDIEVYVLKQSILKLLIE